MNDREQIIIAIEKAKKQSEEYALDRIVVPFKEANMILALLREQPEQKYGHWIEYPKCLEYDGALDDTYIVCSACEHVFNVIDNCTELFDYCPKCGAKMNEENEKEK